jgi:flavodoxin
MNAIIYVSRGGNTKKLAEAIARGAGAEAQSVENAICPERTELLFVGASLYAGKIDERLRRFLQTLDPKQVKKAVVFGSAAGNKTALPEVKSILKPKGIPVSEEVFHCKGSFLLVNRGRPNAEDLKLAEDFAGQIAGTRPGVRPESTP